MAWEREEKRGQRAGVLVPHRHLFAKELRRNFVSQDSGTVPLELSATQDRVGGDGTVGLWKRLAKRGGRKTKVTGDGVKPRKSERRRRDR